MCIYILSMKYECCAEWLIYSLAMYQVNQLCIKASSVVILSDGLTHISLLIKSFAKSEIWDQTYNHNN